MTATSINSEFLFFSEEVINFESTILQNGCEADCEAF